MHLCGFILVYIYIYTSNSNLEDHSAMTRQYSLFILFLSSSYLVHYQLAAQQLSRKDG